MTSSILSDRDSCKLSSSKREAINFILFYPSINQSMHPFVSVWLSICLPVYFKLMLQYQQSFCCAQTSPSCINNGFMLTRGTLTLDAVKQRITQLIGESERVGDWRDWELSIASVHFNKQNTWERRIHSMVWNHLLLNMVHVIDLGEHKTHRSVHEPITDIPFFCFFGRLLFGILGYRRWCSVCKERNTSNRWKEEQHINSCVCGYYEKCADAVCGWNLSFSFTYRLQAGS